MFHRFPIGKYSITQHIPSFGRFYKNMGILLGVVSDCEELVGVTHRGMMGLVLIIIPLSILHFQTF